MTAPTQPTQSVQSAESSDDPRFQAPPWARKRPLPTARQPSPSVGPTDNPIGEPPHQSERLVIKRESPFLWTARLGFVCVAAGIAAFGIAVLPMTDVYSPTSKRGDRGNAVSGVTPTTSSDDNFNVFAARLVVEGRRAKANDPLSLGVSLKNSSGGETVFLTGLESGTRLTAGTPLGCIGWRISERELSSVLAYAPVGYVGTMHAAINLHSANNAVLDTRLVKLEWATKTEQATSEPPPVVADPPPVIASAPRPVVTPPPQPALQLEQDEIGNLIRRGHQELQSGDIAPARLLLRRAALAGSGQAALALGGTYDPEVLRDIGALGFAPNPDLAREWYRKASELGASEATRRLERLAQAQR